MWSRGGRGPALIIARCGVSLTCFSCPVHLQWLLLPRHPAGVVDIRLYFHYDGATQRDVLHVCYRGHRRGSTALATQHAFHRRQRAHARASLVAFPVQGLGQHL